MDDDFKWFAIMFIGLAASFCTTIAVTEYGEHQACIAAMENGYTQEVIEGKTVWVKTDE